MMKTAKKVRNLSSYNIKSLTDGLSEDEIISKYYEYLGLDASKMLEVSPSLNNSPTSPADSLWGLSKNDLIGRSFIRRRKHEKLNRDQIQFLKDQIEHSKLAMTEISSRFFVSPSNLWRIKKLNSIQILQGPARSPLRLYCEEYQEVKRGIKFYNKNWEFPYTVKDVKEYIDDTNEADYPSRIIRNVMINDLNLSFKQCKSRPMTFNVSKIKAARKLFWAHFVGKLGPSTLIINVDESTFSRTSKINYSWSKKGRCVELKNTPFSGSVSMILAIFSNGCWMCLLTPQSINSNIFIYFVNKLKGWLEESNQFGYTNVTLILDNCPSHQSSKSKIKLSKLGYLVCFLPSIVPN